LTPLQHPGVTLFYKLHFNLYTAPAYFACLANLMGLCLLYTTFDETYAGLVEEEENVAVKPHGNAKTVLIRTVRLPDYDRVAVFVCYATRFTVVSSERFLKRLQDMFVRANLETLGSTFTIMMFQLSETQAVKYLSITQGVVGMLTLATYLAFILFKLEKW
jgi:hypothetical protein